MDTELQNFYQLFDRRRSVREYQDREIEPEKLSRILEIARRAPSAANCQPWKFIILPKGGRETFDREVFHKPGFRSAPVVILACADAAQAWTRRWDGTNYAWVDVTIAVTDMLAAATAEGLGSCWVAAFDPVLVRHRLQLPPHLYPVALITLGYPPTPLVHEDKPRKPQAELFEYREQV